MPLSASSTDEMTVWWVVKTYQGDKAKHVMGMASAGLGYFILKSGKTGNQLWATAAFRRPLPLPEGVEVIPDPQLVERLGKASERRSGAHEKRRSGGKGTTLGEGFKKFQAKRVEVSAH